MNYIFGKLNKKLKGNVNSLLNHFGLEIRRKRGDYSRYIDPFLDQKTLLGDRSVNVIFDVGANLGQTINNYRKLFETSLIYCFEPYDESFAALSETFKDVKYVKPFKLAVSDRDGTKQFYRNKNSATNSLLRVAAESKKYVSAELTDTLGYADTETIEIDNFCRRENINKIGILKMDIQGAELMALQGASNLLKSCAIDLIYTEVLFAELYENQAYFCDLWRLLKKYGYALYGLYNLTYGDNTVLAWGDAIFISPEIEDSLTVNQ